MNNGVLPVFADTVAFPYLNSKGVTPVGMYRGGFPPSGVK